MTPSASQPVTEGGIRPEERLHVAMLLSAAGGFLDAFTWLAHGNVFANAQTGNVVLLGLFSALGQWHNALRHVPPIAAFVLGVYVAHRLRVHGSVRGRRRIALFSLALEVAVLMLVAIVPPARLDLPIVLGVAFVAALQSSCFSRVEGWGYSSVMTTGNLRRAAEAMFAGSTSPHNPADVREARVFATICSAFALGSAAGAAATAQFVNAGLVIPIGLLAVTLLSCLWSQDPSGQSPDGVS